MQLVLSIFSGIDILGRGFEENGFSVVSAGDIIFGQDICKKSFPSNKFEGVIGGSPCQDFSKARRTPPTGYGLEMLSQFKRVVEETKPHWFLLENVPQVPDIELGNYKIQRFNLNANECGSSQNRNRKFQFGSIDGLKLSVIRDKPDKTNISRCLTASEGRKQERRSFADFCELQNLPVDFDLPEFHLAGKYRAVGNGVNLNVARRVAMAIFAATENGLTTDDIFCVCGCGRIITGRKHKKCATNSCRSRVFAKNVSEI